MLTAASAALVPWTIYLAITLPRHYTASHWRLTWVGLDIVMSVFLARTAWLTHRRAYGPVVVSAVVAGTLLFVDAWFDVTTATGRADRLAALATAVFGEIPLALLLFWVAHRALNSPHRTPTAAPTATPTAAAHRAKIAAIMEPIVMIDAIMARPTS